jgi:hypothetical protein
MNDYTAMHTAKPIGYDETYTGKTFEQEQQIFRGDLTRNINEVASPQRSIINPQPMSLYNQGEDAHFNSQP